MVSDTRIYTTLRKYSCRVGATVKVIGDLAWKSPRYNQRENKGRFVKLMSAKVHGNIIVFDNKRGKVSIGKTDTQQEV